MANDYFRLRGIEIETNTNCNFRCKFCPNNTDPKKVEVIDMDLFNEILDKALQVKSINIISISSYSEPSLNPKFEEIVETIAKKTPYELTLYTNGTNLTKDKLDLLKKLGNMRCIIFGIPSLNSEHHKKLTMSDGLQKTLDAMNYAISIGIPSIVSIPGTINELMTALPEFYKRYYSQLNRDPRYAMPMRTDRPGGLPRPMSTITDRCGTVKEVKYKKFISIKEPKLFGCTVVKNWLYLDVKGNLFLCCEDFNRDSIYGNIKDGSISEILDSEKARLLRSYVDGTEDAPENFICRKCVNMCTNMVNNLDKKEYGY